MGQSGIDSQVCSESLSELSYRFLAECVTERKGNNPLKKWRIKNGGRVALYCMCSEELFEINDFLPQFFIRLFFRAPFSIRGYSYIKFPPQYHMQKCQPFCPSCWTYAHEHKRNSLDYCSTFSSGGSNFLICLFITSSYEHNAKTLSIPTHRFLRYHFIFIDLEKVENLYDNV